MNAEFRSDLSGTERVGMPNQFDAPVFRRPDEPTPTRPPQLATVGERVLAYLLDSAVWGSAYFVTWFMFLQSFEPVWLMLWAPLFALALFDFHRLATKGYTFGKQMVGLRLGDEVTYVPIGWGRAFVRGLVLGAVGALCFVPLIVMTVLMSSDSRRQGWHDKAARSVVVRSRGTQTTLPSLPDEPVLPAPPGPPTPVAMPSSAIVPPPNAPPISMPVAAVDPTPPVVQQPVPVQPAVRWILQLEDGSSRQVTSTVLVGRDPLVEPGSGGAVAWSVVDPQMSVSKTHAAFGVTDGRLWVEDRHSTNGVVVDSRGREQLASSTARTELTDGDVVRLGDLRLWVRLVGE
jgi:uncharacterized RDD family membrane protein YckC